jgi:hypothetical protein
MKEGDTQMSRKGFWRQAIRMMAWAVVLVNVSSIADGKNRTMTVGKNGDVTFSAETIIGNVTLKPGRYFFEHKVTGDEHFVRFTEVTKPRGRSFGGRTLSHPGDIKCRLEKLDRKARQTIIIYAATDGSTPRITRIVINGEDVAHVFD